MDLQVKAVRNGWLPFYPQFNKNTIELVKEAEAAGAKTNEEIINYVVKQLKERKLKFSVEDPDAPENWPRVWYIWRGNALMSSGKGHEYFLRHYLGTHDNAIAEDLAKDSVHEVTWHDQAPKGKLDLIVDLNFRMDTSALYSDIILPAATWYEKSDLNSTDMHSFIHPLSAAVPPCWESKSDWAIFRSLAKKFSELAALDLFQNKKKSDLLKMFFSPVIKFIKHYFLKLGFMDGSSGLRISYISAWATFHKYRTLKSLEINSQ